MDLIGKSLEQIEAATRNKRRQELLEIIYSLATLEPMYKPAEIAARRGMSKGKVIQLIKTGVLPAHKPLETAYRVKLSTLRKWDEETAVFFADKAQEKLE